MHEVLVKVRLRKTKKAKNEPKPKHDKQDKRVTLATSAVGTALCLEQPPEPMQVP